MGVEWSVVMRVVLLAALTGAAPAVSAQGGPGLDEAASDLSAAIHKAAKQQNVKVLVTDFTDSKGVSELGQQLADRVSDMLAKEATGFVVLDREALHAAATRDRIPAEALRHPETLRCYGREFDATILVEGWLQLSGSDYEVLLTASPMEDRKKKIFEKQFRVELTDEGKELASHQAIFPLSPARGGFKTDPTAPAGGARGYSMPVCANCPSPQFSPEAIKEKFEGSVVLMARIDPDGHAGDIVVMRGLACELNRQAIAAVSQWRFKPALGPDGQPAAVTVPIEVTFRLY